MTARRGRLVSVVVDSASRIRALEAYSQAVSNPKSPWFRHFLTPAQLYQRFGPTDAMIQSAKSAIRAAGWDFLGMHGFLANARVPQAAPSVAIPVSPDIWSISGIFPHGVVPELAVSPRGQYPAPAEVDAFRQNPIVLASAQDALGDRVSVFSFNPAINQQIPAGLPINLFVAATAPDGASLPIASINQLTATTPAVVQYGANPLPATQRSWWQITLGGARATASVAHLAFVATLADGMAIPVSVALPEFVDTATALPPLTARTADALAGMSHAAATPAPIAIFALGTPPSLLDLAQYLNQSGLPMPPVVFHFEDGATAGQSGPSSDLAESTLDIEAAAGAAPGAPIADFVYPAHDQQSDPLLSFLNTLSQQSRIKVATISYGFYGENLATLNALMAAVTAEGITVVESSGDHGAWNAGSDPGPIGLDALEQVPDVLSVGGLDVAAPALLNAQGQIRRLTGPLIAKAWGGDYVSGLPTTIAQVYTSQNAASTGGFSPTTPVPSWQAPLLPTDAPGLGVPMVASVAGTPGLLGVLSGRAVVFGGTSLAAPLEAGWLDQSEADLGVQSTGLGNINPTLFMLAQRHPTLFTQALWGSNGAYQVTSSQPGSWNPVTGLGWVNWASFVSLYPTLSSTPSVRPTVQVVAPASATAGQTVILTARAVNLTGAQFQFWFFDPQNDNWINGGPYSTSPTYRWAPPVPGPWRVVVYARSHATPLVHTELTVPVAAPAAFPMVSGLTVIRNTVGASLPADGSIQVTAQATGNGASPWYQFWLQGPHGHWRIVQGYGVNPSLTLSHLAPGSYLLSVYALDPNQIAQRDWTEAYNQRLAFYVGGAVTLSAPSTAAIDQTIQVSAQSINISHPQYQLWVKAPNRPWAALGGYSSTRSWPLRPDAAGTYWLAVYAKTPLAPADAADALSARATLTVP